MASQFAGADWIAGQSYGKEISALGKEAADLLGNIYLGIYHMNPTSLSKVDWADTWCITVTIEGYLATIDADALTRLVVLSHDRMLRVELMGIAPGYMQLLISKRKTREGSLMDRMPTLEDHALNLRRIYGDPLKVGN